MDSAAINSFIPTLDQVDSWSEILTLLPILIILELLLSAAIGEIFSSRKNNVYTKGISLLCIKSLFIVFTYSIFYKFSKYINVQRLYSAIYNACQYILFNL